jgi:hypothetical protein
MTRQGFMSDRDGVRPSEAVDMATVLPFGASDFPTGFLVNDLVHASLRSNAFALNRAGSGGAAPSGHRQRYSQALT